MANKTYHKSRQTDAAHTHTRARNTPTPAHTHTYTHMACCVKNTVATALPGTANI